MIFPTTTKKVFRELWLMKGQSLAIALVVASGVATFVMSISMRDSLQFTLDHYYQSSHFAHVFANAKRAPLEVLNRIRELNGVQQLTARVDTIGRVELSGFDDPITAQVVGILPEPFYQQQTNRLYLKSGRLIAPYADDELLISDAFAAEHQLNLGDSLSVIINGHKKQLTIVGIGFSPEFIYQIAPGALFPDFKRYAIIWMSNEALASSLQMEGAFNQLSLVLNNSANSQDILDQIDHVLEPYGGTGAFTRDNQLSHRFLTEELKQLKRMATMFPTIFLGVAAFLLNVVISRQIHAQREIIATLKAFGYRNTDVTLHYMGFVCVIVLVGVMIGSWLGQWMGEGMANLYMEFYRFPYLNYRLAPEVISWAIAITLGAAFAGTVFAVYRAVSLPPAEAMRPEAPARFRPTFFERLGLGAWLSSRSRMILRQMERRPVKVILSVTGVALSCSILMVSSFFGDSVDYMAHIQFHEIQREDATVHLFEPVEMSALYEIAALPGVLHAEPTREVAAKLHFQNRSYRTGLSGTLLQPQLRRLVDEQLREVPVPERGIVLNEHLANILGIRVGNILQVEMLQGRKQVFEVPVVALVKQLIGLSATMHIDVLNELIGEGMVFDAVQMRLDSNNTGDVIRELNKSPRVASVLLRERAREQFYETMAEQILIFMFFSTLLSATITFGVVYNGARISYEERARELASMRVLGYTQGEVAFILLGELTLITLIAIPVGFLVGQLLCSYMASTMDTELFRMPFVLEQSTYAFAALIVLVASVLSAWAIRRKLGELDLVGVLKTRE